MNDHKQSLTGLLTQCAHACNHCAVMCMKEEQPELFDSCIRVALDCAQVCRVTGSALAAGSEHAMHLLKECREICTACADECSRHHGVHFEACSEICRRCAEACEKFYVSSTV